MIDTDVHELIEVRPHERPHALVGVGSGRELVSGNVVANQTRTRLVKQQVEAMEREGFVYFPNILSLNEVEELRQLSLELEPLSDALDTDLTLENDGHFQRCINAAFNRDPLFLKYLDKPGLIELAEAMYEVLNMDLTHVKEEV